MEISTVNILIGGLIALISTVVTLAVSSRRDMNTERRRAKAEHLTLIRDTYAETIGVLYELTTILNSTLGQPEDISYVRAYSEKGLKLRAKLLLISTQEIYDQYKKVLDLGKEVIHTANLLKGAKRSPSPDAETARRNYTEAIMSLSQQMRQHLAMLEEERIK